MERKYETGTGREHAPAEAAEPVLCMGAIERLVFTLTGYRPGRSTLHRWILGGRLKCTRIGGRFYATESAIREMLAADEQRNRGSVSSRGTAAAARIERIAATMPRGKRGRR
jgi:hypothetical protein